MSVFRLSLLHDFQAPVQIGEDFFSPKVPKGNYCFCLNECTFLVFPESKTIRCSGCGFILEKNKNNEEEMDKPIEKLEKYYCRYCQSFRICYPYVTGPAESQTRCSWCYGFDIDMFYKPIEKSKNPNICFCKSCDKQCMFTMKNPTTKCDDFFCINCKIFQTDSSEETTKNEEKRVDKTIEFGSNCEICNRFCQDKCTCNETKDKQEEAYDIIEKPYHYNVGIEVDSYIVSWNMDYRQGNIIKYVTRYPYKDPTKKVQDLKKAKWYLEKLIEKEEKNATTK